MGPSKKKLKATRKFESRHLKGVLERRKAATKIKQRQQIKEKKKTQRAKDAKFIKGPQDGGDDGPKKRQKGASKELEMSVAELFQGGFDEIIDGMTPGNSGKLGKRKRETTAKEGSDAESDSDQSAVSVIEQPVLSGSDDEGEEHGNEGGMSKATMDDLALKDPEFYTFLKKNDPEALDFDEGADLGEVDELSASDDGAAEGQQAKKKRKKNKADAPIEAFSSGNELTLETVASWRKAMQEKQSLRAARQVVLAFRSAARLNEQDDSEDSRPRWVINNPEVFNDVLVLALKEIPNVMSHHLPVKKSAAGKVYVQMETKKFKTLSMLLKSHISSIMHLLGTLSDDKTLKLTLSSITPLLPYLLSFKKLVKALTKAVVNFWAQPASSETIRITAFLVLRRLASIGDKGIRETVLKATYQGLIQGCRVTNHNTIQGINLMKNSAAELWGMDPAVGYTTAFAFIRQLAIHLRNSIVNNKNDSFRMVYNWQFTHSLDFWSCVLSEHCSPLKEAEAGKESQLKPLIYPLVQVTLGAMRLLPSSIYFPLRFHLIRSILRLSRATDTYIPLGSVLLEVLASAEMKKPPKPSTLKALDFSVAYKTPKSYLRTRVYQDGLGEQVIELLSEFLFIWAKSIAFPELELPITFQLKRWLKVARSTEHGNRNAKLSSQLLILVQKIEANANFIEQRRAKVDFAPIDRAQVDGFLRDLDAAETPLGAFVVAQRAARAEKLKVLAEAREKRKRKEEGRVEEVEGDDEEDSDVELNVGEEMDEAGDLGEGDDGESEDEDEYQTEEEVAIFHQFKSTR